MTRDRRSSPSWALSNPMLVAALALLPGGADAFPQTLTDWQDRYEALSPSGDNAQCQLCHANANGGSPWNAYGWDVENALGDTKCDLDQDTVVSNAEAFFCIEQQNSDNDGSGVTNATEIGVGTQPGWTEGAFNTLYSRSGTTPDQLPPDDIGALDPDGTEPPPTDPPGPPSDDDPHEPLRELQYVWPGESIQRALDRAIEGGTVIVFPGEYRETADATNGLSITRGVKLIGVSSEEQRVVLQNAGNQRNGIVAVPADRTECMDCHTSLAPPFELREGVEGALVMKEPMLRDLEIRGITIANFENNGLFTENVDGFEFIDIESIDNPNYGIFPTLSKNGFISESYATGADDSGIWVETSENVEVTRSVVEGNTNGFEVSNSDDIVLHDNVARNNTVGFATLLLPDIFDDRAGAKRVHMRNNLIYDNNKPNTARPGSVLATVPYGTGILHLGVDDSEIQNNWIENNKFTGIAIADYCLTVVGSPFGCNQDPSVTPEYREDETAKDNRVTDNVLIDNGLDPDPDGPFSFAAADIILLTAAANGNCYEDNDFATFQSLTGELPECMPVPEPASGIGILASLLALCALPGRRRSS